MIVFFGGDDGLLCLCLLVLWFDRGFELGDVGFELCHGLVKHTDNRDIAEVKLPDSSVEVDIKSIWKLADGRRVVVQLSLEVVTPTEKVCPHRLGKTLGWIMV